MFVVMATVVVMRLLAGGRWWGDGDGSMKWVDWSACGLFGGSRENSGWHGVFLML
jgi:hypothetical protein